MVSGVKSAGIFSICSKISAGCRRSKPALIEKRIYCRKEAAVSRPPIFPSPWSISGVTVTSLTNPGWNACGKMERICSGDNALNCSSVITPTEGILCSRAFQSSLSSLNPGIPCCNFVRSIFLQSSVVLGKDSAILTISAIGLFVRRAISWSVPSRPKIEPKTSRAFCVPCAKVLDFNRSIRAFNCSVVSPRIVL